MNSHAIAPSTSDAPALSYPCGEAPPPGQAREIVPGVLWLRMPLPFTLNHINLWALADSDEQGDGWAIVDCGTKTPETIEAWRNLTAPDGPLAAAGRPPRITRVICTHMHPDHVGMSGWLTRKFRCRLWMTRLEYLTCRLLAADTQREAPPEALRFYAECGWPAEAIDDYRARFGGFGKLVHPLPDAYRRITDGERLDIGGHGWRIVVGRGHSPEHACLVDDERRLMISGDQVLPKISSNVSVFPTEPDADPLGEWLASIDHLRATLDDDLLVLPAHNEPFRGLHARLERLASGHQRGLERLRATLATGPKRSIDVFGALFARPIEIRSGIFGMATGESVAHLNYLVAQGQAKSELDADGVRWFSNVA